MKEPGKASRGQKSGVDAEFFVLVIFLGRDFFLESVFLGGGFFTYFFIFQSDFLGEMIQFDEIIFFKGVGEKPPTSYWNHQGVSIYLSI